MCGSRLAPACMIVVGLEYREAKVTSPSLPFSRTLRSFPGTMMAASSWSTSSDISCVSRHRTSSCLEHAHWAVYDPIMDQSTPGELAPGDFVTIAIDESGNGIWWPAGLFSWMNGRMVLGEMTTLPEKLPADVAPALVVCCEVAESPNTQRICVLSSKGFLAVTWIRFVEKVHYRTPGVVHDQDA